MNSEHVSAFNVIGGKPILTWKIFFLLKTKLSLSVKAISIFVFVKISPEMLHKTFSNLIFLNNFYFISFSFNSNFPSPNIFCLFLTILIQSCWSENSNATFIEAVRFLTRCNSQNLAFHPLKKPGVYTRTSGIWLQPQNMFSNPNNVGFRRVLIFENIFHILFILFTDKLLLFWLVQTLSTLSNIASTFYKYVVLRLELIFW